MGVIMFNLKLKSRNDPLEYTLAHRPRVTRRLHLELDECGGLVIVAPKHWSDTLIRKTIAQNTDKISRFMARATRQQLDPLAYASSASHLYLGELYSLALGERDPQDSQPQHSENVLNLPVSDNDPEAIKTALQYWYRQRAALVFGERLTLIAARTSWANGIDIPLSIRRMKRTWGNCSSSGKIKLNVHLVKAPIEIVDSVIAHELCHLKEMNHSKRFYALLETINPDWRNHRFILRADGHRYLQE